MFPRFAFLTFDPFLQPLLSENSSQQYRHDVVFTLQVDLLLAKCRNGFADFNLLPRAIPPDVGLWLRGLQLASSGYSPDVGLWLRGLQLASSSYSPDVGLWLRGLQLASSSYSPDVGLWLRALQLASTSYSPDVGLWLRGLQLASTSYSPDAGLWLRGLDLASTSYSPAVGLWLVIRRRVAGFLLQLQFSFIGAEYDEAGLST